MNRDLAKMDMKNKAPGSTVTRASAAMFQLAVNMATTTTTQSTINNNKIHTKITLRPANTHPNTPEAITNHNFTTKSKTLPHFTNPHQTRSNKNMTQLYYSKNIKYKVAAANAAKTLRTVIINRPISKANPV
jgi:hypothetical protein